MCCTCWIHTCVSVLMAPYSDIYHRASNRLLSIWPLREVIMRLCSYCWRGEQIPTDRIRLDLCTSVDVLMFMR